MGRGRKGMKARGREARRKKSVATKAPQKRHLKNVLISNGRAAAAAYAGKHGIEAHLRELLATP